MIDWFHKKSKVVELPSEKPPSWTTMSSLSNNFTIDKVKVSADTDGSIKLDLNGTVVIIDKKSRHEFLDKIRTAVQMADVADPNNDQLNQALTK